MDAARRFQRFGQVVDKDKVAFSQPTQQGFSFAKKYLASDRVKCYV